MKTRNSIRKINFLISLALIGILVLQVFWILNAIKIEEQKYDRLLTESLNNIAVNFQSNQNLHRTIDSENKQLFKLEAKIESIEEDIRNDQIDIFKKRFINSDNIEEIEKTVVIKIGTNNEPLDLSKPLRIPPMPSMPSESSDSLHLLIQDMVLEYRFSEKDIQERLAHVDIEEIIDLELEDKRLSDEIIFYIHENEELIWTSESTKLAINETDQGVHLFPFSDTSDQAFIRYRAPSKFMTILERVWLMCFFSLLFTILILYAYRKALNLYKLQLKLNEQKNNFINNMGHEFKTPIATIQLAAQTMQHERILENSEQSIPLSKHIIRESKRLEAYIERILSSAQLESSGFNELQFEQVDIRGLIFDSLEQLKPIIDQKKVEITVEPSAGDFFYQGDKLLLTGVFRNILENSLKYSGEQVQIAILIKRKGTNFEIAIKDDGHGMNEKTQSMIFEQFYRLTKGNIHDVKGLGLGLYFAKQVIENHGGHIRVESKINEGTTFNIILNETK